MTARLMQLYAMRSMVDALILEETGQMPDEAPPELGACPACGAPEEKQLDTSTLDGQKSLMCLECRRERDV
jgi:hypothetical protein